MYYRIYYPSPLGRLSLVASQSALVGIWLQGQTHYEAGLEQALVEEGSNVILTQTKNWLDSYFAGRPVSPHRIPLADRGTAFQQQVWSALDDVMFGQVLSYGDLAGSLDCRSAQAIGNALARNPWLILRPCHRIIKQDGHLGGYAGGLVTKAALLDFEGVTVDKDHFLAYARKED